LGEDGKFIRVFFVIKIAVIAEKLSPEDAVGYCAEKSDYQEV
jgi:hypothetical protein